MAKKTSKKKAAKAAFPEQFYLVEETDAFGDDLYYVIETDLNAIVPGRRFIGPIEIPKGATIYRAITTFEEEIPF